MGEVGTTGIEEPRRLADFLRESRDEILAHWEAEVRKVRAARDLDRPALIDHLPEFLEELAEYVGDLRTGHDVGPPEEHPRIHALERLEAGYDLAEVVAEYAILRRCITELAARKNTPALRSAELPRLHEAIDQAIASSVVRYAEARERTLRALDRIASAALVHHDVESLLPRILDAFLATTASVDTVALALREEDGMRVRAAAGFPEPGPVGALVPEDGFVARVARDRIPLLVHEPSSDPWFASLPVYTSGTLTLYGVPLTLGAEILGVAVMGSRTSREFSQDDQLLFRTMVNRVSALISQARLDEQMARRAAELEAVLDAIPEAIYVGDSTGIKRANAVALETFGYRHIDDLDKDIAALIDEIDIRYIDGTPMPLDEHVYVKALRGERTAREALVRHRGTGEDVAVRMSAAPVRVGDRIVGAVAVQTDISMRLAEEAELRAALQFRDRILGVLSHDVRNPLAIILTAAAILERQLKGDDEKRRAVVRRIAENANRIERMVRDLLDYTRTRQGRGVPIEVRDADVLELCREAVADMQVLHPDRTLEITASGDTRVSLDPDRAAQVISNLLGNALLHGAPGAPVRITVRGEEKGVVLEVHNDGNPIPQEMLSRIFEPFERAAADGKGLGLGLYIAQQIVQAHGGTISVRSDAGDGTTFSVVWPREAG